MAFLSSCSGIRGAESPERFRRRGPVSHASRVSLDLESVIRLESQQRDGICAESEDLGICEGQKL